MASRSRDVSSRNPSSGRCDAVTGDREREHAEQLGPVRVDRGVDELPGVLQPEAATAFAQVPLDDGQPAADRLQRLDREPALVRPLARGDVVPRGKRRVEVARVIDAEVAEPGADTRLVDDAVAAVTFRQGNVRLERGLDELGVGARPGHADEDTDMTALDEPETARAAGDLRELPREQVAAHLAVELRRLGEQQRLAGQVDAVTEHVRGDADVGAAGEEPVDLLAARRERHRPVQHGDAVRAGAD